MSSFDKFEFNQEILDSIKELKFNTPTSIQSKVIPNILSSESDIIATAQTGTGKTAAFGLPIIQLTNNRDKNIECVILCPTRELCLQISKDLNTYSSNMKYYRILPIYGGSKIQTQIKGLRQNPKIIVCTPGRLNDLIKRRRVDLSSVKYFVLDEADEMLSMGFKTEIDKVLNEVPQDRKIYLFSATLSPKVKRVTETYMKKPLMISTSSANQGADTVKHVYYISNKSNRYDIIRNIIDLNQNIYTIIFCRTRRETKEISNKLIGHNYKAKVLNGDLSQAERDQVMDQFRTKKINILVATDVASRGIDVNNLSHIINYNLPDDSEVYVHRSGRTGRAGNEGLSIAFISKKESYRLKEIEKLSKISFKKNDIPTKTEVFKSQIYSFTQKIVNAPLPSGKDELMYENIYSSLENFSKSEIIGKIISLNMDNQKKSKNVKAEKKDSYENKAKSVDNLVSKVIINVGRSDKMNPETLIRLVNKTIRSRDTEIGKIDIKKNHSIFEVNAKMKDIVISKMQHIRYNRKRILVSDHNEDVITLTAKSKKNKKRKSRRRFS